MFSSLKNLDVLFQNKLAAKNERMNLRKLYLEKHGVDIFPLFAGSLFLSAVEIAAKSSHFREGLKMFLLYAKDKDVKKAAAVIPVKGGFKIVILLLLFKMHAFLFMFCLIAFARKIGIKRW